MRAAAFALLTALGLFIAPTCAPLCAGRTCSSATESVSCHEMAGSPGQASLYAFVSHKKCQAIDLAAVLAKAQESLSPSRAERISGVTSPLKHATACWEMNAMLAALHRSGIYLAPDVSPLLSTVLRI